LVALVLIPLMFMYAEWSLFLLVGGFLIVAWLLLCYVGHTQAFLIEEIKKRRGR
jgi:hypothetical protein